MVNTTTELVPGDEKMLNLLVENKKAFEAILYEYLLKGETEGQIKKGKELKSIAVLLFTLYSGLKVVSKVQPNKKELTNSVALTLSLLD